MCHLVSVIDGFRDIRLQSLVKKRFSNQKQNELLKSIIHISDNKNALFFRF